MSPGTVAENHLHILLIEDSPADILLVKEALNEHQVLADLEVLTDGENAYNYWTRFLNSSPAVCPDLVLLDLNLPKRGGLEILQRMREIPFCAALKVIVISSSMNPKDIQQADALGVHQYFRKPNHFEEFMELGRIVKNFGNRQEQELGGTAG